MTRPISHFRQSELAVQRMLCLSAAPEMWGTLHGAAPRARRHQPDPVAATREVRGVGIGRAAARLAAWVGGLRSAWRRGSAAA